MKELWIVVGVFVALGCSPADDPSRLRDEPVGPEASGQAGQGIGLTGAPEMPLEERERSPAGSIKSYFDDTELEPAFETGSIFANGFSLDAATGMGGASASVPVNEMVEVLGLGSGDLTVLALFDRSVSMSDPWEGQPRWQAAGRAFMKGLEGYEQAVTIGTLFFPQAAECEVAPFSDPRQIQFQAGTRFKQQWEAFPQNRFPSGGTPLGAAFEEANHVVEEAIRYGLLAPGRRFRVAVITDGRPNCGTDQDRVLFLAREWVSQGVEINVIGLPGSDEASEFLDRLAQVGGTQRLAPESSTEAEDSFSLIVR